MVSCVLAVGAAYGNLIGIGAVISFLHIASQVPASVFLAVVSTHHQAAACFVSFFMLLSWMYFRLACLPWWIREFFTNATMGYPAPN